jgi:hypothetical protein
MHEAISSATILDSQLCTGCDGACIMMYNEATALNAWISTIIEMFVL